MYADAQSSSGRSLGSLETPLSIFELTDQIKSRLEKEFFEVVVTGEVSNFKPHPSGHYYFSLKDEKAALSAVMFRSGGGRLKFQLQDGMKVLAIGRISVYPPRGNYQIVISRLEPAGLGALQLAFEQLKKRLEAEGLFRPDRKRPLPRFPKTVGIVTAPAGAAIRDMLNVLNRRFSGVRILIYPAKVQGVGSAEEIASGIQTFNRMFPEIDVMIVGRGGGSIEDLWAFNEEVVARAIYESKIPVISAVGHEVDFTIADFVADLRAPTPSAAAELVIGNKLELIRHLEHLVNRLSRITHRLEYAQMKLDELVQRMYRSLESKVSGLQSLLQDLRIRLSEGSPLVRVKTYASRLALATTRLKNSQTLPLERRRARIENLITRLKLLNPMAIMERGYSIVRLEKSRSVVKKASDVQMGDKLLIQLWKGQIKAKV